MQVIRDIAYAELPHPFGLADLYLPENLSEKTPIALAIHGGGWCALDRFSFAGVAEFLCENGFAVFNIEYRLTGIAPWPACGDDCLKAASFLTEQHNLPQLSMIQDRRLVVIGASSGGHLALMTGLRMPQGSCRAVISISGVDEHCGLMKYHTGYYDSFFGHEPPYTHEELFNSSPSSCLKPDSPPILLTHCLYDNVVDIEAATLFEDAVRVNNTPVKTYYYNRKNDGHCIWIKGSSPHRLHPDIAEQILAFLRKEE